MGKQTRMVELLNRYGNDPSKLYYYGRELQNPTGGAIRAHPGDSAWRNEFSFGVENDPDQFVCSFLGGLEGFGGSDDLINVRHGAVAAGLNGISGAVDLKGVSYTIQVQVNNAGSLAQRRWWGVQHNTYMGYDFMAEEDIYGDIIIDEDRARLVILFSNNRR